MNATPIYGGVEAGGTKWVLGLGNGDGRLLERESLPTTTPAETIALALAFFARHEPPQAIGIGAFGPVDLAAESPTFGHITTTAKPNWQGTDVVGPLRDGLDVPVSLDTDVNVAALGESAWGQHQGCQSLAYVTVGTGIGGGLVVDGQPARGRFHAELGHIRVPRDKTRDPFEGCCPFHGDCLEGLASGEAMRQRWGRRAETIDDAHAWELEAEYIALGLVAVTYACAPDQIIVGGGVLKRRGLLEQVHRRTVDMLAGYGSPLAAASGYIKPPALGDSAGVLGAIELARRCDEEMQEGKTAAQGGRSAWSPPASPTDGGARVAPSPA